jgi:hypothetical protein
VPRDRCLPIRPTRPLLAALLLLSACSRSHGGGDGGEPFDASACPPVEPPRCVDERCCAEEAPARRTADCGFRCPDGYVGEAICDPAAACEDFASPCARNEDCTLAITDCCGPCGEPSLTDYAAIAGSRAEDHFARVCPDPDALPCPGCAVLPNPSLGATCEAGRCVGYDVRALELSACTADDDCRVRTRDCCECGGATDPSALIAVRADARADYAALVCDDLACPECVPVYPDTVEAFCAADGHCDVRPAP